MVGNVAGLLRELLVGELLAGALLAGEFFGSARAGPVACASDCARAETVYRSPGISTAVKAN
jgi:hypothetical protein